MIFENHHREGMNKTEFIFDVLLLSSFCEAHGPSVLFLTERHFDQLGSKAPWWLQLSLGEYENNNTCSIINDHSNNIIVNSGNNNSCCYSCERYVVNEMRSTGVYATYYSSQRPSNSIYSKVRNICLRSLSCEYIAGSKEDPFIFGDNRDGFALSFQFKIIDGKARGGYRIYSLSYVSRDLQRILWTWPVIERNLRRLAREMQMRAERALQYQHEMSNHHNSNNNSLTSQESSSLSPLSSSESNNNSNNNNNNNNNNVTASATANILRGSLMKKVMTGTTLQSLPVLLKSSYFFSHLHERFVWILSAVEEYAPPLIDSTLHPFLCILPQSSCSINNNNNNSNNNNSTSPAIAADGNLNATTASIILNPNITITCFGSFARIIHGDAVRSIIYNAICGNQVIILGANQEHVSFVLSFISQLVPEKLRSVKYNIVSTSTSTSVVDGGYEPVEKVKFLGMAKQPKIVDKLPVWAVALFQLDCQDDTNKNNNISGCNLNDQDVDLFANKWRGEYKETTLGSQIELVLSKKLTAQMELRCLNTLQLEWLNKAKVFKSFTSWNKDYYNSPSQMKKFISLLSLIEEDLTVLRHFALAL